jgi:hypothetical protein
LMLVPCRRKLTTLLHPAWRATATRSPPGLLFHREIPHKACICAVPPQHVYLRGRGQETIAAGHRNMISKNVYFSGEGRAITPWLCQGFLAQAL